MDKPPKSPDFYHTCYTLSGLSLSQRSKDGTIHNLTTYDAVLKATDPVLNICSDNLLFARRYFANLGVTDDIRTTSTVEQEENNLLSLD